MGACSIPSNWMVLPLKKRLLLGSLLALTVKAASTEWVACRVGCHCPSRQDLLARILIHSYGGISCHKITRGVWH